MKYVPESYGWEQGDIIVNTMYDWIAIRCFGGIWKHSNQDHKETHEPFNDNYATKVMKSGTWDYVGNRKKWDK